MKFWYYCKTWKISETLVFESSSVNPVGNYIFKVNYKNNKVWNMFIVNNKGISYLALVFLLLTLSR